MTMQLGARLTLVEAEQLARQWQGEREAAQEQAALDARFADVGATDLIRMWESRTNERRRPLSPYEVRALVERWVQVFGCPPPSKPGVRAPEPEAPSDDTMLRMPDVLRMVGKSRSQLKRDIQDGKFPAPMKLGVRSIGWPAAEVNAWIADRDYDRGKRQQ